jgi:hypothetical protein
MSSNSQPPVAPACARELLARGLVTQVELCSHCGVLHFTIGSLTMRIDPAACRDVAETLAAALGELDRRATAATRRPRLQLLAGGAGLAGMEVSAPTD